MYVDCNELDNLCQKYGLKYEQKFNRVYLYTKYETFYFEENNKQKVKLMHQGRITSNKSDFHEQLNKPLTLQEICIYVSEHTRAKYSNKFIKFSV